MKDSVRIDGDKIIARLPKPFRHQTVHRGGKSDVALRWHRRKLNALSSRTLVCQQAKNRITVINSNQSRTELMILSSCLRGRQIKRLKKPVQIPVVVCDDTDGKFHRFSSLS